MKKPRIFFFGTPQIAVPTLEALANNASIEVAGVGVFPDKPVGRKQILTPCPVKKSAENLGLPIYEIATKKDLEELTLNKNFDLGIVIAFGLIFPKTVLTAKPFVNVHFSLLPEWRGASPVQAAILNGQTTTGITWQKMVQKLDAGDVLHQHKHDITGMNTMEVWDSFAQETAKKSADFLDQYFREKLTPKPQNEDEATFCGKFVKTDGLIDPAQESAQTIWHKYLAFTPWPGIYLETKYGNLKLTQISLQETEKSADFLCADKNKIFIQKAQLAGKKEMSIADIINGYPDILS